MIRWATRVSVWTLAVLVVVLSAAPARAYNPMSPEVRAMVQRAVGYRAIVVNGAVTFEDGECTGATPGRLLRHGVG